MNVSYQTVSLYQKKKKKHIYIYIYECMYVFRSKKRTDLGGPELGMCGMIKWVDLAPNPFLRRNEVGWWSFSKNISKERTKWDGERDRGRV